jgi:hypothetical protein
MLELRCGNKLHGILANGTVEIACNSSYCGATKDVMVLHYFDKSNGQLKETIRLKKPER